MYSEQHQRNVCNTIYHRLKSIMTYDTTVGVLKSKIKLIKPTEPTVVWDTEDFGLSAFTEHPVDVAYIEGNHVTILDNPACGEEINVTFGENVVHFKESLISTKNNTIKNQPTLA